LGKQGKRGYGVLGKVTLDMYDILLNGKHHKRIGGEMFFPQTTGEVKSVIREFSYMPGCQE
jgi:hypothetical protein